ncbi:MAG: hypothetical protein JNK87_31875 [Bryobacterales bacterium]|nr:hypothetical protein [Bryobacterales bacterium]
MHVDPGARVGLYPGRIVVNYDMFLRSPYSGDFESSLDFWGTNSVSHRVIIRVTAADTGADVPEPGLTLLTGGCLALGFWIRRRK